MSALLSNFPEDAIVAEEDSESLTAETMDWVVELLNEAGESSKLLELLEPKLKSDVKRFWAIDPIDGTKGFLRENRQYAVCIALLEGEGDQYLVKLAVLACPELPFPSIERQESVGTMFFAIRGQGAFQVHSLFTLITVSHCRHSGSAETKPTSQQASRFSHLYPLRRKGSFGRGLHPQSATRVADK